MAAGFLASTGVQYGTMALLAVAIACCGSQSLMGVGGGGGGGGHEYILLRATPITEVGSGHVIVVYNCSS